MPQKELLFAIIWGGLILLLSLLPGSDLPDIEFDHIDKLGHAVVYGIFSFLIYKAAVAKKAFTPILLSLIISIVYGVFMEFLQGALSQDRHPEFSDMVANAFGAIFVAVVLIWRR